MNRAMLLCLLLVGCANHTDKFLTDERCVKSHTEMMMVMQPVYTSCGNNCNTMSLIPTWVPYEECDASVNIIYPNPDYRSPK